jgi:hypothetical protein
MFPKKEEKRKKGPKMKTAHPWIDLLVTFFWGGGGGRANVPPKHFKICLKIYVFFYSLPRKIYFHPPKIILSPHYKKILHKN